MFKIITDNGSDLSPSFLSENDVGCMYLSTILEGKVIAGKDKFLSAEDFYRMLREGAKPSTSQINPSDADIQSSFSVRRTCLRRVLLQ